MALLCSLPDRGLLHLGSSAFLGDIFLEGRTPVERLLLEFIETGLIAAIFVGTASRRPQLLPLVVVVIVLLTVVQRRLGAPLEAAYPMRDVHDVVNPIQIQLDAVAAVSGIMLGYVFFVVFIAGQGVRQLRLQTEMNLAREIHAVLVPPLTLRAAGYEVHGRSLPVTEVGGDLIDVVEDSEGVTCFLADVSGHGVPAGVLMSMMKSAGRMRLRSRVGPAELLAELNAVLLPLKKPNMFATCAALRLSANGRGEFALAGHLPILLFRKPTGTVERLTSGGPPLGILAEATFPGAALLVEDGDVLAVVTDGLTEAADRRDREFALEGVEAVLAAHAGEALPELFDRILDAVRAHGRQRDDQTLLLVRRAVGKAVG